MSTQEHNRQKFSQIFFPFFIAILVIAAAAYYIFSGITSGSFNHRVWGDISAVLVILSLLLLSVFILIFFILIIFLMGKTHSILAIKLPRIYNVVVKIARISNRITTIVIKPMIMSESALAGFTRNLKENKKERKRNG